MENIRESKEYKLAKDWEMAVNSFSFNPRAVRRRYSRYAPRTAAEPLSAGQGMSCGDGRRDTPLR